MFLFEILRFKFKINDQTVTIYDSNSDSLILLFQTKSGNKFLTFFITGIKFTSLRSFSINHTLNVYIWIHFKCFFIIFLILFISNLRSKLINLNFRWWGSSQLFFLSFFIHSFQCSISLDRWLLRLNFPLIFKNNFCALELEFVWISLEIFHIFFISIFKNFFFCFSSILNKF